MTWEVDASYRGLRSSERQGYRTGAVPPVQGRGVVKLLGSAHVLLGD